MVSSVSPRQWRVLPNAACAAGSSRGDVSDTSYIAGAEFSANGGSRRNFAVGGRIGEGLDSAQFGLKPGRERERLDSTLTRELHPLFSPTRRRQPTCVDPVCPRSGHLRETGQGTSGWERE